MSDNGKRACTVETQCALAAGFPARVVKSQTSTVMSALPDASDLPFGFSFRFFLQTLLVPGVATLGLLVLAQRSYPEPAHLEKRSDDAPSGSGLSPPFWLFLTASPGSSAARSWDGFTSARTWLSWESRPAPSWQQFL